MRGSATGYDSSFTFPCALSILPDNSLVVTDFLTFLLVRVVPSKLYVCVSKCCHMMIHCISRPARHPLPSHCAQMALCLSLLDSPWLLRQQPLHVLQQRVRVCLLLVRVLFLEQALFLAVEPRLSPMLAAAAQHHLLRLSFNQHHKQAPVRRAQLPSQQTARKEVAHRLD